MPQINMKKFYVSSFAFLLIAAITMVGCKKKEDNTPAVKEIPLKVTELLLKSKENLGLHSQKLQIIDFVYDKTLDTESERNSLVEKLTDPKSSWYGNGNILVDNTVTVSKLESFTTDSIAQENLKKYVEESIFVGNQVVKINWKLSMFNKVCQR